MPHCSCLAIYRTMSKLDSKTISEIWYGTLLSGEVLSRKSCKVSSLLLGHMHPDATKADEQIQKGIWHWLASLKSLRRMVMTNVRSRHSAKIGYTPSRHSAPTIPRTTWRGSRLEEADTTSRVCSAPRRGENARPKAVSAFESVLLFH